jgi:putative membrane protein
LAGATIATQIAYPLVDGEVLRRVTIASVVLFFLASVSHAALQQSWRWTGWLVAVTAGGGLIAELVGVHTGVPFGEYAYANTLGPSVADVPLVVPLAWTMMSYPMLIAARRISRRFAFLLAGAGLAGWDVFLDPQMVRDGHWVWADPSPSLPAVETVPITNYVGWLMVATLMMVLLDRTLPRRAASEAQPATLLFWTYLGSIVGNLLWFGTVGVAAAGSVAMGVITIPYAWSLWRRR